jgi:two-component system, NtrC family, response regulator AlgB
VNFLVIDDSRVFREAVGLLIEEEGHAAETAATAEAALASLREAKYDAVLLDLHLGGDSGLALLPELLRVQPNQPVVVVSAQGTIQAAVEAIRLGALDFLEKPFTPEQFHAVVARLRRFRELGRRIEKLEEQVQEVRDREPAALDDFESPAMRGVMDILRRSARSPASVLLLGESGTGKTMAARALHARSNLADRPFVTVSCPSLSAELLESQLFGHVRGAFTGALRDHWGKVKAADGGTLFLDEIGDLPLEIQPKLLRLLQEREYERVGETVTRRANVRIVAATNRDLGERVAAGGFRQDLFYRLNVITVRMPPLRERPGDVLRFAEHYLAHSAAGCGRKVRGFTPRAAELLRRYPWPGNLRELRNSVERSVILSAGEWIDAADLPREIARPDPGAAGQEPAVGAMVSLERLEELHIRRVLEHCPSFNQATEVLGINLATLYRKRKKLGLAPKGDGSRPPPTPSP